MLAIGQNGVDLRVEPPLNLLVCGHLVDGETQKTGRGLEDPEKEGKFLSGDVIDAQISALLPLRHQLNKVWPDDAFLLCRSNILGH